MFKYFRFLAICLLPAIGFVSCGPDEPDPEPVVVPSETLQINETNLKGTWYQGKSSGYANENYISFNGLGSGEMVLCADLFTNAGFNYYEDGKFAIVSFTYNINGDNININPNSKVKPFTVRVLSQTINSIYLSFPYDFNIGHYDFEKYSNDPFWFSTKGPGSIDLTEGLEGRYQMDDDFLRKFTVTKVNNYTLTITDDLYKTETTGQLYWRDKFNPIYEGRMDLYSLTNPTIGMSPFYKFRSDCKLYINGIGGDYSATKITNTPNPNEKTQLAGTSWSGIVDGDTPIEISFGTNGILTETCDGETEATPYTENGNTITFGDELLLYTTFGGSANFELNTNKTTLKIYNRFTTWELHRKY